MGTSGPVATQGGSQRQQPGKTLAVQQNAGLSARPEPSRRWLSATRDSFETYLDSEVNGVLGDLDLPALARLFDYYDLWERAWSKLMNKVAEEGDSALVELGASDQAVPAVELQIMTKLEGQITKLEERFGVSPLVRARLGIEIGTARLTADKVNSTTPRRERPDEL